MIFVVIVADVVAVFYVCLLLFVVCCMPLCLVAVAFAVGFAIVSPPPLTLVLDLYGLFRLLVYQEASFEEARQWARFLDDKDECAFRVCVGSKVCYPF